MTDDSGNLHEGLTQLLDGVTQLRRATQWLAMKYVALDASVLDVDYAGPTSSTPEILSATYRELVAVDTALSHVTECVHDAMRYSSRLMQEGDRQ